MTNVAIRDLRNNTAEVVREAHDGQTVVLTSRGGPIAHIIPLGSHRRRHSVA
ncbi:MAG: type II toxin-antitoxin system prevent-host-death family antitoxin [Propionibacteriaceae bacterium]|nr:type II toxin-antitoxin system prevent-host-death family antitoxin [Propionibacteriaceae bacterium]